MKKFKLKNTATSTTVGRYDTKKEAIKAMDCLIFKTNSGNGQTEEDGLSPFDFTLEITEADVADVINSIDEARKYLNLIPNTSFKVHKKETSRSPLQLQDVETLIREINPHHLKAIAALNQLFTIAEAWNKEDGFTPDFSDRNQTKWFPWFVYSDDAAGFVYAATYNAAANANAYIGSRLCFKSSARAAQFGKQFTRLYNEIFTL